MDRWIESKKYRAYLDEQDRHKIIKKNRRVEGQKDRNKEEQEVQEDRRIQKDIWIEEKDRRVEGQNGRNKE